MIRLLLFELEDTLVDSMGQVFPLEVEALKIMKNFETGEAPRAMDAGKAFNQLLGRLETAGRSILTPRNLPEPDPGGIRNRTPSPDARYSRVIRTSFRERLTLPVGLYCRPPLRPTIRVRETCFARSRMAETSISLPPDATTRETC